MVSGGYTLCFARLKWDIIHTTQYPPFKVFLVYSQCHAIITTTSFQNISIVPKRTSTPGSITWQLSFLYSLPTTFCLYVYSRHFTGLELYNMWFFVPEFLGTGLEFELRTLHLKLALYHLSHTSSPFCSGYFGDRVS
jgi:hypothetical protein